MPSPPDSGVLSCGHCGAAVPAAHKFCGSCGHAMAASAEAPPVGVAETAFFGAMQATGQARLVLIRGEGMDGVTYHLNSKEHVAGRKEGQLLFPEDNYLSPRHATLYYEGDRLFIRDESSLNGIFVRIMAPTLLSNGDVFLVGEELLRVETAPLGGEMIAADETHYFASPPPAQLNRLTQIFEGGRAGMCYFVHDGSVTIGREACDIAFSNDRFISGRHCQIDFGADTITVSDLRSRNGTYVRVKGRRELSHGDYLFLGKQLLRVEITTG